MNTRGEVEENSTYSALENEESASRPFSLTPVYIL
jgi:hypothetical protein